MIVVKTNENLQLQVILLQMDDILENRFKLDKLNPAITNKLMYKPGRNIEILKSIALDQTYCFFMGSERLTPIMVNHYIRKLNDFGVTSCIYINEDQFSSLLIEKPGSMECSCDSQQLLWKGHSDKCNYKKKYINKDFIC